MNRLHSLPIAAAMALSAPLAALAQNPAAPTPAEATFKRVDANADGKISKEEAAAMPGLSAKFVELDRDKDGALSLAEFSVAYAATPTK
jgi:Ca2+-binding EF-hand superfamily protein